MIYEFLCLDAELYPLNARWDKRKMGSVHVFLITTKEKIGSSIFSGESIEKRDGRGRRLIRKEQWAELLSA